MKTETFLPIPISGYEGKYQISDHGRVKSCKRISFFGKNRTTKKEMPEMIKTNIKYRNGYLGTMLTNQDGKRIMYQIHRLVALAFLPNPENKPCVNHIDGKRENNHISNLAWATYSENNTHNYRALGHKHHNRKLTEEQVFEIRNRRKNGEKIRVIAEDYPVSAGTINDVITGRNYPLCSI